MDRSDVSKDQVTRLGGYIREQRHRARLSLRQLAELANVSNPYLSQIERGLHEPSVRVLKAIAAGLDLSADVLLAEAGLLERKSGRAGATGTAAVAGEGVGEGGGFDTAADAAEGVGGVEAAIAADQQLTPEQRRALILVYRSYLSARP